ncbi:MAG: hypothetical protein VYE73_18630 [Acidobacteriota bacterium]|nr:hypothetical protein [Acidobacteriota bacterium]
MRLRRILPCLALVSVALAASLPLHARPRRGDRVVVSGVVLDSAGEPLGHVDVVLTAGKSKFALSSFRRTVTGEARVDATSDEEGGFALGWTWNPYYNVFRLDAVIRVRGPGGGWLEDVVGSVDVTQDFDAGGAVSVERVIEHLEVLEEVRAFISSLETEDLRATYEDMGKPDRVDRLELAKGVEVAWWYFRRGRSYHFLDGDLEEEVEFEPLQRRF